MRNGIAGAIVFFAVVIGSLVATDPALGQAADHKQWVKLCEWAPIKSKDAGGREVETSRQLCLTHHERLDGNTGMVLVSAAIRQVEGQSAQHLLVMVPLGMAQTPGLRAKFYNADLWAKAQRNEKVDDSALDGLKLGFSLCHPAGCTAEVEATPDVMAKMRGSAGMMVFAINAQGQVIAFPVPLYGFAEAFDGKPMDNADYSSARNKLIAEIGVRQQAALSKSASNAPPGKSLQPVAPARPPIGRRVALVIGNSKYASADQLINPRNDARAMAAKLKALGFAEVREHHDLSLAALNTELKHFGDIAANSDWAVIFFAGHGIQVDGISYLLPVDVVLSRPSHIADEAVPLDRLLQKVADAKQLKLVILDSCRNNPFRSRMVRAGGSRSLGRGLAAIEPTGGVLVAYATRDGQVADDGDASNSPFTAALLRHLDEPELEIGLLFRRVRDTVFKTTGGSQEPFVYGSLPGVPYYFAGAR